MESAFDSGADLDLGFTKRALENMEREQTLLSTGSSVLEDEGMPYDPAIESYSWNGNRYQVVSESNGMVGLYKMINNNEVLFEANMDFGAEGPIQDWRVVDGKPAFTFYSSCEEGVCASDVWYDGSFLSKKYSVENPRYVFSYNGKLGFVASKDGMDSIFYNGAFITPGFSNIWTHNCCSYTEILPTIYDNGVLLFYAKRDEQNYLVEVSLQEY